MRIKRDIISSTITWHPGLAGSNNFGEYTSFSPFTLGMWTLFDCLSPICFLLIEFHCIFSISYNIITNYVYYYFVLIWIV